MITQVEPDESFGIELTEAGSSEGPGFKVTLDQRATARVMQSLKAAIKESGVKPGQMTSRRKTPLELNEAAGVRLALIMLSTKPISSRRRLTEIEEGVTSMSTEETYYWYAKCTGPSGRQGQKALRLLMSGE